MTKTRKVGTLTLGCILVLFGVLFLVHMFLPSLSYEIIFRLWPLIFILLGLEVLGTKLNGDRFQFVYDKASVFLLILMTFFAMTMAFMDAAFQYHIIYWQ